jgi:hypothetical protein
MTILRMRDRLIMIAGAVSMVCTMSMGGCGLAYQAGARIKTGHMLDRLQQGESMAQVRKEWGEPDLRQDLGAKAQRWSYARRPNSNDLAATIFYTSTKSGDESKFLDLKFIDGKLVSWSESEHMMPAKQGAGFSYGFGPGGAVSPVEHY